MRNNMVKKRNWILSILLCIVLCFSFGLKTYADGVIQTQQTEQQSTEERSVDEQSEEQQSTENTIIIEETQTEESIKLETPTAVSVKQGSGQKATIRWKKSASATGYRIYRSTTETTGYKRIATVGNVKSYTDKKVKNGTIYYYKVRAICKNNTLEKSDTSSPVMLCMKPAKVEVEGEYTGKKIKLTWEKVKGAEIYYIYKKNASGTYKKIAETKKLTYKDADIIKEKAYYYKVAAVYEKDGSIIKGNQSKVCKVYASTIDPNKKMVALTFDDGPGPYTDEIVQSLKKNNGKATFFVVGNRVNTYKNALKNAYAAGNEIANHSYDHTILTRLSASGVKRQMSKTDAAVKNVIGVKTSIARTPGGATNTTVKSAIGKPIIYWSIDTLDWKTRSKTKTINAVLNNIQDGDIVLMHDIHQPTKEAALYLISKLKKMGYQLVTVSELAKYRGYKLKNGTVYSSFRK